MRGLLAIVLISAFGVGCGGFPATTQGECRQGELATEVSFYDPGEDVLLIIEPALAEQLRPRLLALLRAMATGDTDDLPGKDVWVPSSLRVAAITPQAAARLVAEARCADESSEQAPECPHTSVPFARYSGAPYGFADDADAFAEHVLCLLGSAPEACASPQEPGELAFGTSVLVWLVTTRDACDPFGFESDCDQALSSLVEGFTRSAALRGSG